jgi:membrane-bound lytic murein transglycosylase F
MKRFWPSALTPSRKAATFGLLATCTLMLGVLSTCSPKVALLKRVETLGVLRVATLNSPTTYYVGANGLPVGFEYDLAKVFADEMGLKLELMTADTEAEVLDLVLSGRAHLGAGLSVTPAAQNLAVFTPPLRSVALQLVYRSGSPKPKTLYDLEALPIIPADGVAAQSLRELKKINPALSTRSRPRTSSPSTSAITRSCASPSR